MSTGPIEFLGETFVDEKPASEYGGGDGLIAEAVTPAGTDGHVELTASEVRGVLARRAGVPLTPAEAWTGISSAEGEDVVDPVTGRVVEPTDNQDVTGKPAKGQLSDLKPA